MSSYPRNRCSPVQRTNFRVVYEESLLNGVRDLEEEMFNDVSFSLIQTQTSLRCRERRQGLRKAILNFSIFPVFREYSVVPVPPPGWEEVTDSQGISGVRKVFLPAGGIVRDVEFGFEKKYRRTVQKCEHSPEPI